MIGTKPYAKLKYREVKGRQMAYLRVGQVSPSGPDRYRYSEHRDYLFALWDALDLGDRVLLVLDDWGAVLKLDWARQNSHRVQGIVHMEAVAAPLNWSDLSEEARSLFRALRSKSRPSKRWPM